MADSSEDFRRVYLPYALMRLSDGTYLPVNRRYKPLGSTTTDWVNYEGVAAGRVRLTERQLEAVATARSDDRAYLYNDGCLPLSSDAAWKAYARRLEVLAGCKVA